MSQIETHELAVPTHAATFARPALLGTALSVALLGCTVGSTVASDPSSSGAPGGAASGDTDTVTINDPALSSLEQDPDAMLPSEFVVPDATGELATLTTANGIDLGNPFFQELGTNGRRCVSCHLPTAGWSITPAQLRLVFDATGGGKFADAMGLGAVFRPVDGSNSPDADLSTVDERRAAYSMLLTRGVIRIGLPMPSGAEFDLSAVDDPYGHASADDLSLFRRPLPATNLRFLATVMWDGRESQSGQTLAQSLAQQASDATRTHAEGNALGTATRATIVGFETTLYTAQASDTDAGPLDVDGAFGGADDLVSQAFYPGINAPSGDSQTRAPFTQNVFDLYDAWISSRSGGGGALRQAIARGQALFNTRTFQISGVAGVNDEAAFGNAASVTATCSTCHNAPNAGSDSLGSLFNLGQADGSRRTSDLPLYTLRNRTTGATKQVTDPGRALITGRWKDVGRFKVPTLRGLAGRAPYFHNGSAATLADAIDFYQTRFGIDFTAQEKADLAAFLQTL